MNRIHLLAIGTILMFALTAASQQATSVVPAAGSLSGGDHPSVPTAESQLTFLSGRLDLTGAQQDQMKPILQELHDATVRFIHDENMSREERMGKVRDSRYAADKKIRVILNDDQKKKLDQLEQEPHPELHGDIGGPKH